MTNWITHVPEPDRLLLAWQAADHFRDRHRWAVGELRRSAGGEHSFRYLDTGTEFESLNNRTFNEIKSLGYQGYPAFPLAAPVTSGPNAIGPFLRRIPPRSRSDFDEYARYFRIQRETRLSDFALLGLTEAKLPSDGFSIVDPLDLRDGARELVSEVAGYRYYAGTADAAMAVGRAVEFLHEPTNSFDPKAVLVAVDGRKLGYINRLQAPVFLRWIEESRVVGRLDRVNGNVDKPRAFLFIEVLPKTLRVA